MRRIMQHKTAKAVQSKRKEPQGPDPRFAAFARLLARDLARAHFEKELEASQAGGYDSDSPPEDQSRQRLPSTPAIAPTSSAKPLLRTRSGCVKSAPPVKAGKSRKPTLIALSPARA